jgi:HK97 family phage major capsid protein
VTTGKLTAGWVEEAGKKPTSESTLSIKSIVPKKLAVIAVVSAEVVRANPGGYMQEIQNQVGEAFALAFDAAAFHGTSTPFATFLDQSTKEVEFTDAAGADGALTNVYSELNAGLRLLVNDSKKLTGFAFDTRFEPELNDAKDSVLRPLFVESPFTEEAGPVRLGRLLGRRTVLGDGVYDATEGTLGYGGDWTQTAWGTVGGISYDISTQATVTIGAELVSLFENNLVAVRAEAEYGWLVNDPEAFVKYVNAVDIS